MTESKEACTLFAEHEHSIPAAGPGQNPVSVFPLKSDRKLGSFGLYEALRDALDGARVRPESGDVIVVSTKFVAVSQGRTISMAAVRVSELGLIMSRRFRMMPQMAELVIRESDAILGGMNGFVLSSAGGLMAPNGGIDASNAGPGTAILYPDYPYRAAESLRRQVLLDGGISTGVILADSRLMPGRVGTVGVAVAYAGIEPVRDMRGRSDLDGKPLRVTFQAVADSLASAANYTMGEGSESTPFALIRGSRAVSADRSEGHEAVVDPSQCVYTRSLGRAGAVPLQ